MRPQRLGQKPRRDVEIFVVRLGELLALGAGFVQGGRDVGNAVARRKRSPSARDQLAFAGCAVRSAVLRGWIA